MDSDEFGEGFVKQDESVFTHLSSEALDALKGLALDKGIDTANDEDQNDVGTVLKNVRSHFDAVKVGSREEVEPSRQ